MLGKLLKHEVRATSRLFIPIYIAILLFASINRIINPFHRVDNTLTTTIEGFSLFNMIRMVSAIVYFALIVAIIAMTFVIIIQRFYKSLLGDEGYLMFTLPVKPWQHIVSKLLVSLLWLMLGFIAIMGSVLILVNMKNFFGGLGRAINAAHAFFGNIIFILIPLAALISSAAFIMTVYNALSIGHLFTNHRILASFGAYIGLYIINQIVSLIFVFTSFNSIFESLRTQGVTPPAIVNLIIFAMALSALLGIANFISANFILKQKLNLE